MSEAVTDLRCAVSDGARHQTAVDGRPRVLHIIGNLDVGGAETDLIAKTLLLKGAYDFAVLTLLDQGRLAERLESAGIPVAAGQMRHKLDLPALGRMIGFARNWSPDILHAHMFNAYLVAWVARLLGCGRRIVYTIQKEAGRAGALEILTERALRPFTSQILTSSGQVLASYEERGVRGPNMIALHNSIDLSRFGEGENRIERELGICGCPVIGTVGRLIPVKGHRFLIRAMPEILGRHPDAKCVVIGYGQEERELKALASQLGVEEAVRFLGMRRDISSFLPYFDAFVMPSLSESFGITAAEASACGVAVVASDVGGLREVVIHGDTGYLIPPADSLAIAGRVNELLSSPSLRQQMGRKGKEHVKQFSAQRLSEQLAVVYDTVLTSGHPAEIQPTPTFRREDS